MTADVRLADISADGLYRYSLTRVWRHGSLRTATFIMLNPSTADALVDDPTIRRCIGFAKSWGCAGLHVVNVYALRATNPKDLWLADDPIGPENDHYLSEYAMRACRFGWPLVAAWGVHAKAQRTVRVLDLPGMESIRSLGTTKDGHPRHPLYLRADSVLSSWPIP